MKKIVFVLFILNFYNCKKINDNNSKSITTLEKLEKKEINNFIIKFVSAKSGLNYRKEPKGEIIGKFIYGQKLQIVEHTNIYQTIKDNNKSINDEWLGVKTEADTLTKYVFGGFLSEKPELKNFYKYIPEKTSNIEIPNFKANYTYIIDENYITVGYLYDKKQTEFDLDYGQRLLFLDKEKKINFKSKGVGDLYLYKPYFYKNDFNEEIIIVCLKSYEYFFGGEAFLIKDKTIKYLGTLDIESNDMEKNLIDLLKIKEINRKKIFSFDSDTLLLKPGSGDILIKNNNIKYEYFNGKLKLIK